MKDMKSIVLGTVIASAGILAVGTETTQASEINSVATIKAEMHKQQGNKQHLAVYRVQKGDTLSGIAEASGLTIAKILDMNDIPNPNLIHVGQLINLGYSQQANQFVSHQGQSVVKNQKHYTAPTSMRAQKAMNTTKSFGSQKQARVSSQPTNQYRLSHQAVVNNSKPANGQWNNTPSGATSNVSQPSTQKPVVNSNQWNNGSSHQVQATPQQKPVVNNGGSSQGTTNGSVNNGGSSVTVDVPATGGNQGQKPTTPTKPSNSGQTTNTPTQKPSTSGNQGSQNQQKGYNTNEINKEYQNYISNEGGWKGQWMTENGYDKADDGAKGYAEVNAPAGGSSKWYATQMGEATKDTNLNQFHDYKYGYTSTSKTDSGVRTDYYLWN